MSEEVYKSLLENLSSRGASGVGARDIPEIFDVIKELYTPEEALVSSVQPPGYENWATSIDITNKLEKNEDEVKSLLESMANKGLCTSIVRDGTRYYDAPPLTMIFDLQFMRGTFTKRDINAESGSGHGK